MGTRLRSSWNWHFPVALIVMELLPAELKRHIVELSSGSPTSLAALARTHTSYQREAEKVLYNTLFISASSDDSLRCMETLATNSEKAALVRFLTVEYARDGIAKNRIVTDCLSKSLIDMHTLSDFRVRSRPGEVEAEMIRGLGKIIWLVCRLLIFSKSKLTNNPAGRIQSRSFSITNSLLPRRFRRFSDH